MKKIQEDQIHTKRQQKLNISDLESIPSILLIKNCEIYFRGKTKNTIISKIENEYKHDETYDLPSLDLGLYLAGNYRTGHLPRIEA